MSTILKNFLADYGYNAVALPKSDFRPLMLLCKDGDSVSPLESPITDLLKPGEDAAPPALISGTVTGDVAASASVSFDSQTGVSFLNWLLDKLKMGKLDAKVGIDSNKILTVKYEQVQEDKVNLVTLDGFITSAIPVQDKFRTFQQKLEDSELYVINAVLKSAVFTITIEDKSGAAVDVDATVKGIVAVNQNIKRNSDNSVTITSAGSTPLIFALKAQHILYNKKGFWKKLFSSDPDDSGFTIKNADGIIVRGPEDYPTEPLSPDLNLD